MCIQLSVFIQAMLYRLKVVLKFLSVVLFAAMCFLIQRLEVDLFGKLVLYSHLIVEKVMVRPTFKIKTNSVYDKRKGMVRPLIGKGNTKMNYHPRSQ